MMGKTVLSSQEKRGPSKNKCHVHVTTVIKCNDFQVLLNPKPDIFFTIDVACSTICNIDHEKLTTSLVNTRTCPKLSYVTITHLH